MPVVKPVAFHVQLHRAGELIGIVDLRFAVDLQPQDHVIRPVVLRLGEPSGKSKRFAKGVVHGHILVHAAIQGVVHDQASAGIILLGKIDPLHHGVEFVLRPNCQPVHAQLVSEDQPALHVQGRVPLVVTGQRDGHTVRDRNAIGAAKVEFQIARQVDALKGEHRILCLVLFVPHGNVSRPGLAGFDDSPELFHGAEAVRVLIQTPAVIDLLFKIPVGDSLGQDVFQAHTIAIFVEAVVYLDAATAGDRSAFSDRDPSAVPVRDPDVPVVFQGPVQHQRAAHVQIVDLECLVLRDRKGIVRALAVKVIPIDRQGVYAAEDQRILQHNVAPHADFHVLVLAKFIFDRGLQLLLRGHVDEVPQLGDVLVDLAVIDCALLFGHAEPAVEVNSAWDGQLARVHTAVNRQIVRVRGDKHVPAAEVHVEVTGDRDGSIEAELRAADITRVALALIQIVLKLFHDLQQTGGVHEPVAVIARLIRLGTDEEPHFFRNAVCIGHDADIPILALTRVIHGAATLVAEARLAVIVLEPLDFQAHLFVRRDGDRKVHTITFLDVELGEALRGHPQTGIHTDFDPDPLRVDAVRDTASVPGQPGDRLGRVAGFGRAADGFVSVIGLDVPLVGQAAAFHCGGNDLDRRRFTLLNQHAPIVILCRRIQPGIGMDGEEHVDGVFVLVGHDAENLCLRRDARQIVVTLGTVAVAAAVILVQKLVDGIPSHDGTVATVRLLNLLVPGERQRFQTLVRLGNHPQGNFTFSIGLLAVEHRPGAQAAAGLVAAGLAAVVRRPLCGIPEYGYGGSFAAQRENLASVHVLRHAADVLSGLVPLANRRTAERISVGIVAPRIAGAAVRRAKIRRVTRRFGAQILVAVIQGPVTVHKLPEIVRQQAVVLIFRRYSARADEMPGVVHVHQDGIPLTRLKTIRPLETIGGELRAVDGYGIGLITAVPAVGARCVRIFVTRKGLVRRWVIPLGQRRFFRCRLVENGFFLDKNGLLRGLRRVGLVLRPDRNRQERQAEHHRHQQTEKFLSVLHGGTSLQCVKTFTLLFHTDRL